MIGYAEYILWMGMCWVMYAWSDKRRWKGYILHPPAVKID